MTSTRDLRPNFRILIVDDEEWFVEQLRKLLSSFAGRYYQIEVSVARDTESAFALLRKVKEDEHPFDAALLDYNLPPTPTAQKPAKNTDLAKYCVFESLMGSPPAKWIGQITSYPDDHEMLSFWPTRADSIRFRGGLFTKTAEDLLKIAHEMFFSEVKEPLTSQWLLEELGAIETPLGSGVSDTPADFNIYVFVDRLIFVWPALDEETRKMAIELFDIAPIDPTQSKIERIGFRTFSCWDRVLR